MTDFKTRFNALPAEVREGLIATARSRKPLVGDQSVKDLAAQLVEVLAEHSAALKTRCLAAGIDLDATLDAGDKPFAWEDVVADSQRWRDMRDVSLECDVRVMQNFLNALKNAITASIGNSDKRYAASAAIHLLACLCSEALSAAQGFATQNEATEGILGAIGEG